MEYVVKKNNNQSNFKKQGALQPLSYNGFIQWGNFRLPSILWTSSELVNVVSLIEVVMVLVGIELIFIFISPPPPQPRGL